MTAKINIPKDQIPSFCQRNGISSLSLFGSVLRDDFRPDSDVDVLVEFKPGSTVGLITLAGIEIELSQLLNRKAEIHTPKGLNPLYRDDVLKLAEVQYVQTR